MSIPKLCYRYSQGDTDSADVQPTLPQPVQACRDSARLWDACLGKAFAGLCRHYTRKKGFDRACEEDQELRMHECKEHAGEVHLPRW